MLIGGLAALLGLATVGVIAGRSLLSGAPAGGTLANGVSIDQVKRDFTADQDAENAALGSGDVTKAQGSITGNALQDLSRQIQINDAAGAYQRTQLMDVTTEVVQQPDPNDPQTTIEVHQTGYAKNTLVSKRTGAVVTEENIRFDTRDWLRPVSGRYAITDEQVSQQAGTPPQTPWALIALAAGVILATALAVVVVSRRRHRQRSPAAGPVGASAGDMPAVHSDLPAPLWAGGPGEGLGVRTMGGLQLWSGGTDLARVVLDSEVSGFIWLLLLVRAILNPDGTVLSDELAEEVFPRLRRENQLGRMRGRRFDIRRFPEPLSERIPREGS
ncbi:MAG: hypothetical protein M3O87_04370, partial [Candidatus Dormibacteraeota bacterium]|nr:hypothetical protein [Candidatus Dormibacteraeota bacterium]